MLFALMLNSAAIQHGHFLTGPNQGNPLEIARNYLDQNKHFLGLTDADLRNMKVKNQYVTKHNGVTHIYLGQQSRGIDVFNGNININIASDGSVINLTNQFISNLERAINTTTPSISAEQSVEYAAQHLGLKITSPLTVQENVGGPAKTVILTDGGISQENIRVSLVYDPFARGKVRLAWKFALRLINHQNWWLFRVDARTGDVLGKNDRIVYENDFRVFPIPFISPEDPGGSHDLNNAPADAVASPYGWHDTDGTPGAEYTDTRGNNVFAQEDVEGDDQNGFRPDGGSELIFDFPWDASLEPWEGTNQAAAIVNLFYWNNIIHDVFYQYGFDEVSGNFQENNYGNGGNGGDAVSADAQDGSGMNNAWFATPSDGSPPKMTMFLWDLTDPSRDGDFENGIITHEYGHGISNRLTGGPSNVNCLWNNEQMGEGWSDWLAMILTTKSTDAIARGMGPYVLGEPHDGQGIRPAKYSTDMNVNGYTYGDIGSLAIPHGVGFVWATMLWEMQWKLINQYGFEDVYTGNGGNNIAIQLVMDGMKLQSCNPGFVDGRDAILLADQINNNGANECLIWEAFAKRGLGYSADQGGSNSTTDGTEAFDMPAACLQTLKISKTASPSPVESGGILEYSLEVHNDTLASLTGITITDNVPADTTYISNSATCGGSEAGGIVTFPIGNMDSGDVVNCSFQVEVSGSIGTTVLFYDDFETGFANWQMTGLWNQENEADNCGSSVAPFPSSSNAVYFGDDTSCSFDTGSTESGELSMKNSVLITGAAPKLNLSSYEVTECNGNCNWDNRYVELSTDGGSSWVTLDELGSEGAWYEASFDLTPYIGENVLVRFRFDSVDSMENSFFGWMVDNVEMVDETAIFNEACVSANEGNSDCGTVTTPVIGGQPNLSTLTIEAPTGGGKLIIKAKSSSGWEFIEWAGDCKGKNNPAKTVVKMNKDQHCAVVFEED